MTRYLLVTLLVAFAALAVIIVVGFPLEQDGRLTNMAYIAQIIEGVTALALLLIAADIRESTRARHLDGIRYVKGLLGSQDASDTRKWVYQDLKKATWPLSAEDEKRALAICRDFDHIGFLCRKNLIPVDLVVETYNRNILDMWNRLERFIVQWREQRRDADYFWEFEWLASKAEVVKTRLDKKRQSTS